MVRSTPDGGEDRDLSLLLVIFSLPHSWAGCFALQAGQPSSWAFLALPRVALPMQGVSSPAMTIYPPQGQPLPTKSINLASVQNQCPFTAANAFVTEASLAMTYLSHYTPIIRGNFKQIG